MVKPKKFSGVFWHKRKQQWQVILVVDGTRLLTLGYYDDEKLAAWVSDFAKYLYHGINPALWNHQTDQPNFPPQTNVEFPRYPILVKLLNSKALTSDLLKQRLAAFDAKAGLT